MFGKRRIDGAFPSRACRIAFRRRATQALEMTRVHFRSGSEEARSAVSKDGRWLGLPCGRPSRRAQVRAPQDEVDGCVDVIRASETQYYRLANSAFSAARRAES